jgi:hypothetical protein
MHSTQQSFREHGKVLETIKNLSRLSSQNSCKRPGKHVVSGCHNVRDVCNYGPSEGAIFLADKETGSL